MKLFRRRSGKRRWSPNCVVTGSGCTQGGQIFATFLRDCVKVYIKNACTSADMAAVQLDVSVSETQLYTCSTFVKCIELFDMCYIEIKLSSYDYMLYE